MTAFPVQSLSTMSLLVRGLVLDSSSTLSAITIHTLDALNLMSKPREVANIATQQSHLTLRQVKASLSPTNLTSLPAELKVSIVAASIDDWCNKFLKVGARLQSVGVHHANIRLPETMHICREWREESLRRLIGNGVNVVLASNGSYVIHRSAVFLCDRDPQEYPQVMTTVLNNVKTVVTHLNNVIPDNDCECGLLVESILTGVLFQGLQTLQVIINPRFHNPIIDLQLPSAALEDVVYRSLRSVYSFSPVTMRQARVSLASGMTRMFQRTCMEVFIPLANRPLWRRAATVLGNFTVLPAAQFHNNMTFFRDNAQLVWDLDSEPAITEHFQTSCDILYDSLEAVLASQGVQGESRAIFDQDMNDRIPRIQACVRFLLAPQWEPVEPFEGYNDYITLSEYNRIMRGPRRN